MSKGYWQSLLNISFFSLFSATASAVSLILFSEESSSTGRSTVLYFMIFFLIAAVDIVIAAVNGRVYKKDLSSANLTSEEYSLGLKAIGKYPLISLIIIVLTKTLGAVAILLFKDHLGLYPGIEEYVIIVCFSWGLLGAAGIYSFSDKVNFSYLSSMQLDRFPHELREFRQSAKMLIIPSFTTILGVAYTAGLGGSILKKYGSLSNIPSKTIMMALPMFFLFLILIVFFEKICSDNNKVIFKSVLNQLDMLSSGEKDLSKRIYISSIDEISSISGLINSFVHNLSGSIEAIKKNQRELMDLGQLLKSESISTRKESEGIVQTVHTMETHSRDQSASITATSGRIDEINRNISGLSDSISEQAASITEASASIEQMVGNIQAISTSMAAMASQFKELAETSEQGTAIQEETFRKTSDIAQKSEDLLVANQVISSVAAQTNLLAMNAAIEAAHAGDAGRGFAVVADEIRKLAVHSAENSKIINSTLTEVRSGIESLVDASQSSKRIFSQVAEKINMTDRLVSEVNMTIDEQQQGAQQILVALTQMNEISSQVQSGSSEMNDSNRAIFREMEKLMEHNRMMQDSISSVTGGISGVNNSINSVSDVADKTESAIARINTAVQDFKI